jgi:hypothetical protein
MNRQIKHGLQKNYGMTAHQNGSHRYHEETKVAPNIRSRCGEGKLILEFVELPEVATILNPGGYHIES